MTIDGDESMTTEGLRAALEAKTGMPVPRMLFKGKALADGELVSFYGIEAKVLEPVNVTCRLAGGGKGKKPAHDNKFVNEFLVCNNIGRGSYSKVKRVIRMET